MTTRFYERGLVASYLEHNNLHYEILHYAEQLPKPLAQMDAKDLREYHFFEARRCPLPGSEKEKEKDEEGKVYLFVLQPGGAFISVAPAVVAAAKRAALDREQSGAGLHSAGGASQTHVVGLAVPKSDTQSARFSCRAELGGRYGAPGVVGDRVDFHNRVAAILHVVAHQRPPAADDVRVATTQTCNFVNGVAFANKSPHFIRGMLLVYKALWLPTAFLSAVPLHDKRVDIDLRVLAAAFGSAGTAPSNAAAAAAAAAGKEEKKEVKKTEEKKKPAVAVVAAGPRIAKNVLIGGTPGGSSEHNRRPHFHNCMSSIVHTMVHFRPPGSEETRAATVAESFQFLLTPATIEARNPQFVQGVLLCYSAMWNRMEELAKLPLPPGLNLAEHLRILRHVYGSDGVKEKLEEEKNAKEMAAKRIVFMEEEEMKSS